jgi:hypothetical protein
VVDIGLNKVVGYFDAEAHRYTDDNGTVYDSATQFVHSFEKPFDKEYWSHYKAKERGVPVEVILAEWDELNKASLVRGNRIHDALEDGLNNSASKSKQQKLLPTGSKLDTRFQKSIVITTVAQLRTIPIFLTYPYIRSYMEKLLLKVILYMLNIDYIDLNLVWLELLMLLLLKVMILLLLIGKLIKNLCCLNQVILKRNGKMV